MTFSTDPGGRAPAGDEEQLLRLRESIAEADAEFQRGEYYEWTPEFMDEIRRAVLEDIRNGVPVPDDVVP